VLRETEGQARRRRAFIATFAVAVCVLTWTSTAAAGKVFTLGRNELLNVAGSHIGCTLISPSKAVYEVTCFKTDAKGVAIGTFGFGIEDGAVAIVRVKNAKTYTPVFTHRQPALKLPAASTATTGAATATVRTGDLIRVPGTHLLGSVFLDKQKRPAIGFVIVDSSSNPVKGTYAAAGSDDAVIISLNTAAGSKVAYTHTQP
jgi:hypothetical protein